MELKVAAYKTRGDLENATKSLPKGEHIIIGTVEELKRLHLDSSCIVNGVGCVATDEDKEEHVKNGFSPPDRGPVHHFGINDNLTKPPAPTKNKTTNHVKNNSHSPRRKSSRVH